MQTYDVYPTKLFNCEGDEEKGYLVVKSGGCLEDGIVYAEDVFEDEFKQCDNCGCWFSVDDYNEEVCEDIDETYCENCIDANTFYCDAHECYEVGDDYYYVSGIGDCCSYYCEENLYWCDHCDSYYERSDGRFDDWDEFVCDDCFDRGCGHFEDEYEDEYNSYRPSIVCGYHNSGSLKRTFLDNEPRKDVVHVGTEIEVHNHDGTDPSDAEAVHYILGDYVVFERDCSIEPGFEIITRPGSIATHMGMYDKLAEACRELVSRGYNSHNSNLCGLHVHIDRDYFGRDTLHQELAESKILWMFAKHWENLVRFSRRKNFGYCEKVRYTNYSGEPITVKKLVQENRSNASGHYRAVNIENSNTIEIRLWRGSIRPETIKATLKFTARIAELVKKVSIVQLSKMSFEEILGDDEDIKAYWETVKDRELPEGC